MRRVEDENFKNIFRSYLNPLLSTLLDILLTTLLTALPAQHPTCPPLYLLLLVFSTLLIIPSAQKRNNRSISSSTSNSLYSRLINTGALDICDRGGIVGIHQARSTRSSQSREPFMAAGSKAPPEYCRVPNEVSSVFASSHAR